MFEIRVTMEIPCLPEAITNLATAIREGKNRAVCDQSGANNQHIDAMYATKEKQADAAPQQKNEISTRSAVSSAPASTEVKVYSVEDISQAGAALCEQGKMADLINLLAKYGVQSIVELGKEHYAAIAVDLKALGANL